MFPRLIAWIFGEVVVANTDADEAGDYRIARRIDIWRGYWRGYRVTDINPANFD